MLAHSSAACGPRLFFICVCWSSCLRRSRRQLLQHTQMWRQILQRTSQKALFIDGRDEWLLLLWGLGEGNVWNASGEEDW